MKTSHLLTSLLVTFIVFSGYTQENSFGVFIASPVGKFKSTDLDGGGFAENGWGLVFDSYSQPTFLPKNIKLYSHSTYQWNKMDTRTISEKFTQALGNRTEVSESRYSPLLTTFGPHIDFGNGEKFKLGISATGGVMFNNTKAFAIRVFDVNDNLIFNELINFDNKVAFAYTFGANLRFQLIPELLALMVYFDYTSANQKTDINSQNISVSDSFQKLQYFNTGFKFVIKKQSSTSS